MITGL